MGFAKDKYLEISDYLLIHDEREKKSTTERILLHYYGLLPLDIALNKEFEFEKKSAEIDRCIELVNINTPIQYILGETEFYGLSFCVNEDVLIPRPETEELVDLILKSNKTEDLTLLDVGTGSGCIPISLKYNRESWNITSIDISDKALIVAQDNAVEHNTDILFVHDSILLPEKIVGEKYDVIVSNPPYITEAEKSKMHDNVLKHEPHLALFVDNYTPLVFYKAILTYAKTHLNDKGKVYFEINEHFGSEMKRLCLEMGFSNIYLRKDLSDRDRIVVCQLIE